MERGPEGRDTWMPPTCTCVALKTNSVLKTRAKWTICLESTFVATTDNEGLQRVGAVIGDDENSFIRVSFRCNKTTYLT